MTENRKINSLGKTNKRTLLKRFGFNNINTAIYHLADGQLVHQRKYNEKAQNIAYRMLQEQYNDLVEMTQSANQQQKKEVKNKFKNLELIPVESTYDRYNTYKIKVNHIYEKGMSTNQCKEILNSAWIKVKKTVQDSIKKYQYLRGVVMIRFNNLNTQEDKAVVFLRNLGRCDTSQINEFKEFFFTNALQNYKNLNEKDYLLVTGIEDIEFNLFKYDWLGGSSYTPLPEFIANTKSVINIKNTDNKCFLWSCIASRHPPITNHAERVSHYLPYIKEFKYDDEDMPMKIHKISKFEKANQVCINVYMYENKIQVPLHISKENFDEIINLFHHDNHYSLIKNFSRFCGEKKNVCPRCMKFCYKEDALKNHLVYCRDLNKNGGRDLMPKENTVTKFNDYAKQIRLPVCMYADFESSLVKHSIDKKAYVTTKHQANSWRLRIETDVKLGIPLNYEYVGEDADIAFVKKLTELNATITLKLNVLKKKHDKPILNQEEENQFQCQENCQLCHQVLGSDRVRDHCHFTGKYRGACHNICNIKAFSLFKGNIKIPLFFHNANYDIKQFINAFRILKGDDYVKSMSGVPCNMEIFKSLNMDNICIMDSYAHLGSSLDKLIKNLPEERKIRLKTITDDPVKFELINKKGLYPYEFVDGLDKLDTPIGEIKREHFNSKLTLSKLSDEDWSHFNKVVKKFNFTTLREYHDLYLNIDVFGLADVFEYYRELSMETYGLDPAHYIGLPSFTWAAGLKETKVELQNITDSDLFMFFEKMKRGGISVISQRYAKANNPYLPYYDSEKDKSYVLQVDCNNLYGWSMCQNLPVDTIGWVENFDRGIIDTYQSTDNTGYVLEVDLEYPDEIHDAHNDYPLAPEHQVINGYRKLAPNLNDKKNYILHIDNLQYYLQKGLKLIKIHRVASFRQEAWLKSYIEKNSKLRQAAKNDFEKDYYKLLNNAFYGKTMENVRDRVSVNFCLDEKAFAKYTSSALFANQVNIIQENGLALVKTHKRTTELNKPIYIGACILESSKLLMFKFHYDTMKVRYPESVMMKTDTDSLCYYIKTDDLYEELKEPTLQSQIEFSNYPKDHSLFNNDRKKQVGIFQDECVDGKMAIISEYVGLRAKSYSNQLYYPSSDEYKDKKKSKGVPSRHIEKRVTFNDYKECLFEKKDIKLGDENGKPEHRDKIYSFRSLNLTCYSIEQSKVALSGNDDKRYILEDNIRTLALGHCRIPK